MRISASLFFPLLSVLLLIGLHSGEAAAQRVPPIFECVRGDTLFWVEPSDPCGTLASITVFGSGSPTGPFSNLALVPARTGPFYALPPAQALVNRYFYLVANYPSCTPMASAPSPTINNEPLEVPRILSIDYTLSGTRIRWARPSDSRVTRFLIYRETMTGTTLLDTVVGTEYFEPGTQVEESPTIYYLGSLNDCKSSSFSSSTFSSATVVAERDVCAGLLRVQRRLAAPWPFPFTSARVIRSRLGGSSDTITLTATDSIFTIPDISPDTAYTIKVAYFDVEGGFTAAIPVDLSTKAFVKEDVIEIAQVSFEPMGWQLRWRWEPRATYASTEVEVKQAGRSVLKVATNPDFNVLNAPVVSLDLPADFDWTNANVVVRATDGCGVLRESEPARPAIVFAREVNPFTVITNWTLPVVPEGQSVEWKLRFSDGTTGSRLLLSTDSLLSFVHDVRGVNFREVCYELVAEVRLSPKLRRGEGRYLWRSAPGCALRSPRVYLPTGFAPEGFTIEYKPKLSLIEGLSYRMEIYDRWGKRLFSSEDPFEGWDGRVAGSDAVPGAYTAIVKLEEPGRDAIQIAQTFVVVR